jgi:hypothetical protein
MIILTMALILLSMALSNGANVLMVIGVTAHV